MVTRNMPPLRGGMERLNQQIAIELQEAFDVSLVGPRGCAASVPASIAVREAAYRPLGWFLLVALARTTYVALRSRPALVFAGSGLTAPIAYLAARLCGARAAFYAHGLDLVAPHIAYRMVWRPFLRRMDGCIANSRRTATLAREIGIAEEKTVVLNPGAAPATAVDPGAVSSFRKQHALEGRRVLLSVGRLTPRKGTLEFVLECLPAIVAGCPDTVLVVIGDEAPDALTGPSSGMTERIARAARQNGLEARIRLVGPCSEAELLAAYDCADALVFPVLALPGDVEGFGMVAIEAAAHGVPTIAFSVGGIPDAVLEGRSGWLVPAGDYRQFAERVLECLLAPRPAMRDECRAFASLFTWHAFGAKLRSIVVRWLGEAARAGGSAS